jgi:hypothetical protein
LICSIHSRKRMLQNGPRKRLEWQKLNI